MPSAGWYPDPSRQHEARWWDGTVWSDQVADNGATVSDPLGRPPPGMIDWLAPDMIMAAPSAPAWQGYRIPRIKIWGFAVLSFFFLNLGFGSTHLVIPVGLGFAIACWIETRRELAALRATDGPGTTEMYLARGLSTIGVVIILINIALSL